MFSKILVPVDLDAPEVAAKAMATARRIAATEGAGILVISVTPDPKDPEKEAALEARLKAYIDGERGELEMDGILNLGGSVAREVRAVAEEMGVDLVVMASHWPRLDDHLFGSRSASVALHSHCSVLVVR
ncbi:universal stress protein [Paralimibaculum aggregatum]|uniref:Universal stress protein n=1 Tax=Paralimibaculum aggregatum TaxID=3036245 RepID=A0ABQ6LTQ4_9RHOB|nr:universal stress protein [Limibaculum sp. NKW23]GMG85478.1 universal stress protein [Limibaculum sp. NKW23]